MKCRFLDANAPGMGYASEPVLVSTMDKEGVLECAKRHSVDGILTTSDAPVNVVSYVGEQLGLPSMSTEVAKICTNKYLQREMFAANGISFFPYPSRYAVRYEGESPYTAMDFARQIKKRPLAELLSMQLLPYEILEVDDGIRPYCFLVERLGHVRCIRFKSDIARESKYEESGGKAI